MWYKKWNILFPFSMIFVQTALVIFLSDDSLSAANAHLLVRQLGEDVGLIGYFESKSSFPLLFSFLSLIYILFFLILSVLFFFSINFRMVKEKTLIYLLTVLVALFFIWAFFSGWLLEVQGDISGRRDRVAAKIPHSKTHFIFYMSFFTVAASIFFAYVGRVIVFLFNKEN